MFANRIIIFGVKFEGRLNSDLLQGVLDYVAYNEESLAFEILCDHICEYDISITDEEYIEAVLLVLDMRLDLDEGPFKHLLGLKQ
ncbi:MafI family immunity protein [Pseudomonas alliivorans]|uniref:MafI family immunity protein n=1 Tax=Pseudomonas alliivorans TaxID=2810613 RepID=UPI001AE98504|nr:MafI family immunity protein [Pseudomonas alliivorans]MBP0942419.1 MafI family immunity protein [Pseudomonas alliivorans]MEE4371029.1 MafI family immunity protein [Pseudomonas alliivorans]MEE4671562.1 MafI family immunity protein [Pseudomonas alliivorans]MEE4880529.1 MafI family immunity protein [Pseudomonas alliivorans]MEE4931622.1 MafI family immunity protein [Pseudomonas alliivorans]